ncbi:hypothetical protein DOTSEDRAFT_70354 [Lecanosticta acicola]|uniref:DUF1365-domain-containing protein n=1 Tax=Lecanosticta acicola TaxID=111012 RepID=A0AAI8YWI0_9PEZI|nr:hypothetical protein DOTSEDRAFT_70354 [Lecanosticta acicola]
MRAAGPEPDVLSKSTVLISIWATAAAFWSIFTPPQKTFAARVLLFQPLWILRIATRDSTWIQDLALTLSLHSVYSLWARHSHLYTLDDLKAFNAHDETSRVYLQVFALLAGCGVLAGIIVHRGRQLSTTEESSGPFRAQSISDSVLPPLLITSRTTHSRLFPKKHAFSYSYLFAGIPVGLQGRVSNVLSVDSQRPAWFDVRSKDYLSRNDDHMGLGEKLKSYLHSQGVTDRDYAYAYLVTAPRFLGYSFNPVSFWYLYDSDTRLKYMVLEVNNTFDERRMYLLNADKAKDAAEADLADGTDEEASVKTLVFTETWDKDFHVSPFNSRKGSYSLRAVDPLAAFQETGEVKIDNTIVLRSSKEHPKLIARACSVGKPIEPDHVSILQLANFILGWWWVGLLTFPRIIWEASKLYFSRKLHVWYRPETTEKSLGRSYTDDERILEEYFRAFLTDTIEHARKPLRVIYEPAHSDGGEVVLYSPGFTYEEDHGRTLTIKVLSPAFYSRFIHYAHAKEAFDRECLGTDDKNRTIALHGAHALPALLDAIKDITYTSSQNHHHHPQRFLERTRWSLLRRLRCPPAAASYPSDESRLDPEFSVQDIRTFHLSELDRYIQKAPSHAGLYQRIAIKLFVAERIALGTPIVVVLADWSVRGMSIFVAMLWADHSNAYDVFRPRSLVRANLVNTALMMGLANVVHFWSFLKGY